MKNKIKLLLLLLLTFSIVGCNEDFFKDDNTYQPISDPIINTQTPTTTPTTTSSNNKKVLILYDTAGKFSNSGKTNAILLQNLLGHFDVDISSKPAIEYVTEDMDKNEVVFYIGNTFNILSYYNKGTQERKSYENFYKDIATKDKSIVWINYNLGFLEEYWKENKLDNTTFDKKIGMTFKYVSQLNYNRILYKDTELFKGVIPFKLPGATDAGCIYEGSNRYACSLELNLIEIVDPSKTNVFATAYSTIEGNNTPINPYISKGDKFWFVGDLPFNHMSEEDRYLAFADLLHDMLGIHHNESHKAIMRLEDVDASTKLSNLTLISDFMRQENIPFSVATIPQYEDPLGIEHKGVPTSIKLSNSKIGTKLKELYDEGLIHVVQHGTTHQYHENLNDGKFKISNPYNGLSGYDFEFMRVVKQEDNSLSYLYPTKSDSGEWATQRILQGKQILNELGIEAFSWEAPHYMAGPNHYRAIAKDVYPIQYSRVLYFPNEESNDIAVRNRFVGQFFPYVIKKDLYGSTIIPENIHNVIHNPNTDFRQILPADIIRFSKKLKVVRDGVASFYYHPFLGIDDLKEIIHGLQDSGYEFVSAPSLLE